MRWTVSPVTSAGALAWAATAALAALQLSTHAAAALGRTLGEPSAAEVAALTAALPERIRHERFGRAAGPDPASRRVLLPKAHTPRARPDRGVLLLVFVDGRRVETTLGLDPSRTPPRAYLRSPRSRSLLVECGPAACGDVLVAILDDRLSAAIALRRLITSRLHLLVVLVGTLLAGLLAWRLASQRSPWRAGLVAGSALVMVGVWLAGRLYATAFSGVLLTVEALTAAVLLLRQPLKDALDAVERRMWPYGPPADGEGLDRALTPPALRGALASAGSRVIAVVVVAAVVLFGAVTHRAGFRTGGDYPLHLAWAQQLAETGSTHLPHFVFQALAALASRLVPDGLAARFGSGQSAPNGAFIVAGLAVALASYTALALVLLAGVRAAAGTSRCGGSAAAAVALALMLVAPVSIATWAQRRLYLGYVGLNVYHNPTVVVLKPLAVAWLWLATRRYGPLLWRVLPVAAVAAVATLTKPSYTLCLVPALLAAAVLATLRARPADWPLTLAGSAAPAALVLAFQAPRLSGTAREVAWAPFEVVTLYAPGSLAALLFIGSILFPLSVALLYTREVLQTRSLVVAWLAFAVGAAAMFLLAERPDARSGNFMWGAQAALFVLVVQSALFLVRAWSGSRPEESSSRGWESRVCAGLFALHLVSGLAWYAAELLEPGRWWGSMTGWPAAKAGGAPWRAPGR